jgi:hypothetical protein
MVMIIIMNSQLLRADPLEKERESHTDGLGANGDEAIQV